MKVIEDPTGKYEEVGIIFSKEEIQTLALVFGRLNSKREGDIYTAYEGTPYNNTYSLEEFTALTNDIYKLIHKFNLVATAGVYK